MKNNVYMHDDYLLNSPLARQLYHECAKHLPIIDYHNHLDAKEIWEDAQPKNLCEAWLTSDHYVWRAMRSNGVDEFYITGDASDEDKFSKWCESLPYLVGNPLYQWSHLELSRFFGNDLLLNPENEKTIWAQTKALLAEGKNSTRQVLRDLKVDVLCTTDSPLSHLQYHAALRESEFGTRVFPTFRADELFTFDDPSATQLLAKKLNTLTTINVQSFFSLVGAISKRIEHFHLLGARLADLGLMKVEYAQCSSNDAERLYAQLCVGNSLSAEEVTQLNSRLFFELGRLYHQHGWSSQIHIGVLPNVNERRQAEIGRGTGFSVMNDQNIAEDLVKLLSELDKNRCLPNTVLYSLNANHNQLLSCIAGAFQDSDASASKIQFGAAWWFNDHKDGMEAQLTTLKNLGALGRFVGMLTDSRNIFSFSRHEYFRRVLCNLMARWVLEGEIPNDEALLKQTIQNICYFNAKRYFKF
ncbi:glucuronate isomerase [Vibrio sp. qd031]|uniref:glucuronate isomerase n=1 Tax=Vibrio sp. qd031 TaxID=1603038 RepID=UPI001F5BB9F9|nr:glucuronate isomerase [Vibrio sp. qd031]